MDGEGNILATDPNNRCIHKFTAEGQFLTAVGTRGEWAFAVSASLWHSMEC